MKKHISLAVLLAGIFVFGARFSSANPLTTCCIKFSPHGAFVVGYASFATAYLAVLLSDIVPKDLRKNSANIERENAQQASNAANNNLIQISDALKETNARIDNIPCVKKYLETFNNATFDVCEADLAGVESSELIAQALDEAYNFEFIQAQDEEESSGIGLSRNVNCRQVKVGRKCGGTPRFHHCEDVYEKKCDKQYYTRTTLLVRKKEGTALSGEGREYKIPCNYFGADIHLLAAPHQLSSKREVWNSELRKTVEDWTTKFQYSYAVYGSTVSSELILDKRQSNETLARQIVDFLAPLCKQTLQIASLQNDTLYDEIESDLELLRANQSETLNLATNSTLIASALLSNATKKSVEQNNYYKTALAIHLPIFFVGSTLMGAIFSQVNKYLSGATQML